MIEENDDFPAALLFDKPLYYVNEISDIKSFSLAEPVAACKLLVLLSDSQYESGNPKEIDLLNKIADWKELNLKRNEVVVVNTAKQELTFLSLQKQFHSPNIIGFGISPEEIGLHIEIDRTLLLRFRGINFIFTSSLQELLIDDPLKKKFFNEGLRPMFK